MAHITFNEIQFELNDGQTVLTALLDKGYEIPNSCRAGACQTCMMQAVDGEVPASAQQGLKDTQKAQGYFLACSCVPTTPLQVVLPATNSRVIESRVIGHEILSENVLRLRLIPAEKFEYKAGQFISIYKDNKLARSYSLASVESLDDYLELHIRRIDQGKLSSWLHDEVKVNDMLDIQQANGQCFYIPGNADRKLILAGTGTGLAPLIGIARDAISQGHLGEIHLVHGARTVGDLYLHQQLIQMAKTHNNFYYHASVLETDTIAEPITTVAIDALVTDIANDAAEWKAYLCGDEAIVKLLKKKLFLAGTSMSNIYTDPFIQSKD